MEPEGDLSHSATGAAPPRARDGSGRYAEAADYVELDALARVSLSGGPYTWSEPFDLAFEAAVATVLAVKPMAVTVRHAFPSTPGEVTEADVGPVADLPEEGEQMLRDGATGGGGGGGGGGAGARFGSARGGVRGLAAEWPALMRFSEASMSTSTTSTLALSDALGAAALSSQRLALDHGHGATSEARATVQEVSVQYTVLLTPREAAHAVRYSEKLAELSAAPAAGAFSAAFGLAVADFVGVSLPKGTVSVVAASVSHGSMEAAMRAQALAQGATDLSGERGGGERVALPCTMVLSVGRVQWLKPPLPLMRAFREALGACLHPVLGGADLVVEEVSAFTPEDGRDVEKARSAGSRTQVAIKYSVLLQPAQASSTADYPAQIEQISTALFKEHLYQRAAAAGMAAGELSSEGGFADVEVLISKVSQDAMDLLAELQRLRLQESPVGPWQPSGPGSLAARFEHEAESGVVRVEEEQSEKAQLVFSQLNALALVPDDLKRLQSTVTDCLLAAGARGDVTVQLLSVEPRNALQLYAGAVVSLTAGTGTGPNLQQAIFDMVRSGELTKRLTASDDGAMDNSWAAVRICLKTIDMDCDKAADFN